MFPLPVSCQLSYSNLCWSPLPKNYNVQIFQSLSWLSRLNWLCQWVGGVCVNRHRSFCLLVLRCFSEQRWGSWENCLEDEWFCCIWFVNVITIFWWESTCSFLKHRHLRWYVLDLRKKKSESRGWLASHFNCTGISSLVDSNHDVDFMQTVLDVLLSLWLSQSQNLLHNLMRMALPIWVVWLSCNKWDLRRSESTAQGILAGHLLHFAGRIQQQGGNFPLMQVQVVRVLCFSSGDSVSNCNLMRTPQIPNSKV